MRFLPKAVQEWVIFVYSVSNMMKQHESRESSWVSVYMGCVYGSWVNYGVSNNTTRQVWVRPTSTHVFYLDRWKMLSSAWASWRQLRNTFSDQLDFEKIRPKLVTIGLLELFKKLKPIVFCFQNSEVRYDDINVGFLYNEIGEWVGTK